MQIKPGPLRPLGTSQHEEGNPRIGLRALAALSREDPEVQCCGRALTCWVGSPANTSTGKSLAHMMPPHSLVHFKVFFFLELKMCTL